MAASYQKAFPAWGRLDPCMSSHPLFFSAEIQIGVKEHGIDVGRAFLFPFLKVVPVIDEPWEGDEGGFRMGESILQCLVIGFFRNGSTGCIFVGYVRTSGVIVEGVCRGDGFRMERPASQGESEIRRPILCAVAVFIREEVPLNVIDAVHAHGYAVCHHDIRFGACIEP